MSKDNNDRKLNDEVYEKIIDGLVTGKYKAGMPIKEMDLAADLGVSRTPVREALKSLEEQGLVTDIPYKGKIVTNLSTDEIINIYDLREVLEGLAGRLASQKISDAEIVLLTNFNDLCDEALRKGSFMQYTKANDQFHQLIITASKNNQLRKMLNIIKNLNQLLISTTAHFPGSMERGIAEHNLIIDGLKKHDSSLVEKLLREHVIRSKEEFIKFHNRSGITYFNGIV